MGDWHTRSHLILLDMLHSDIVTRAMVALGFSLADRVHLTVLDDPSTIGREMDHYFVAKECCQFFHGQILSLLDEEIDDDDANYIETHVYQIHAPATA